MNASVHAGQNLHGVSLPSFLQLLEQERTNCTLSVSADGRSGCFFFREGQLIDARCEGRAGIAAVDLLLSLKKPAFQVSAPEDRMVRISQSLARILLHASSAKDEVELKKILPEELPVSDAVKSHPLLRRLVAGIMAVPEIRHYYLFNRQGKTVARSSDNRQICTFISYAVMSSLQMRQSLGDKVRGPQSIQAELATGELLLILPSASLIIGLLADNQASVPEISTKIRAALRMPERTQRDHAESP
ncbi:MAG: protein of unknown function (DUF4388) [Candidatus Electronema aureum]|uniref:PatA-like N-terminal domain-containing protein n=1 Tax=Candidatus Electronema aureum TaxID=2005002 RepID=A0A521G1I8_9BACT|nr:MAG: protein of unknown function (DUF4388) [Candidatus Electronema aureum]